MTHAQGALGRFANQGKDLGQDAVQGGGAVLDSCAVFGHAHGKIRIRELLHFRFQSVDLLDQGAQFLQISIVFAAKNFLEKGHENSFKSEANSTGA